MIKTINKTETVDKTEAVLLGADLSFGRRLFAFFCLMTLYFFYCYNFLLAAFVRPTLLTVYGLTLTQAESIFAVLGFATIPGALLGGILATRLGKKRTIMLLGTIFATTTFIPMLDPGNVDLWRGARFITGLALGGMFGACHPLVYDMFPQRLRGRLSGIITSIFSLATIFAGMVYGVLGDENWRLLMLTAVIPPLFSVVLIYFFVPDDVHIMKAYREVAAKEKVKLNYFEMYKGKYLYIGILTIVLSGANFVAYAGYVNNSTNYLTQELGMTSAVAGQIYSLLGLGLLFGYNSWGYMSDRIGRKFPIIGFATAGTGIFIFSRLGGDQVTLHMVTSFLIGFSFGFSGCWGCYYTELFPNRFRAMAPGISFNGGRLFEAPGLLFLAAFGSSAWGLKGLFAGAALVAFTGVILWAMLPETLVKDTKKVETAKS